MVRNISQYIGLAVSLVYFGACSESSLTGTTGTAQSPSKSGGDASEDDDFYSDSSADVDDDDDDGNSSGQLAIEADTSQRAESAVVIDGAASLTQLCNSSKAKRKTHRLDFPDLGKVCDWGQDGNLSAGGGGTVRARREQPLSVNLPKNAVLCSVAFSFSTDKIRYDDHIFFTFNDVILFASSKPAVAPLIGDTPQKSILAWEVMKKRNMDGHAPEIYCAGSSQYGTPCVIPRSQEPNPLPFDVQVHDQIFQTISLAEPGRFDFTLMTVGDNDTSDCQHSPLAIDLSMRYMLKK